MATLFGLCYAISPSNRPEFRPSMRLASPTRPVVGISALRGGSNMDKWIKNEDDEDEAWEREMEKQKIQELLREGESYERARAIVRNETLPQKHIDPKLQKKIDEQKNMTYTELMTT
jgi:hypothetical protein